MRELVATISDSSTLADCERVIERGVGTFVEVGAALSRIRDGRLYGVTHETFESYCRERWDIDKPHAYRLIQAAEITHALVPIGTIPKTESQARELAPLRSEPEKMAKAWKTAIDETAGKPTARILRQIVRRIVKPAERAPEPPNAGPGPFCPEPTPFRTQFRFIKDHAVAMFTAGTRAERDLLISQLRALLTKLEKENQ